MWESVGEMCFLHSVVIFSPQIGCIGLRPELFAWYQEEEGERI